MRISRLGCLILVTSAACSPPVADTAADGRIVRGMLAEWYEASNAQNLDVLVDHYEEGGTILAANWPAATGSEAIREYFLALWADTAFHFELDGEAEEIHISGDLAILRGTAEGTVTPSDGSEPWVETSRFVEVYRRQADGSWKSLWDIWNSPLSISELATRWVTPQG